MPAWGAILLAVAATALINLGFALQKRGAAIAGERKAAGENGALVRVRVWRTGIAIMSAGWVLYFVSAKFAPISIIQPTLGAGMAVLALFSVFYLHEKISAMEWAAFAGMLLGVLLLGLSTGEEEGAVKPATTMLGAYTVMLLAAAGTLYAWAQSDKRADVLFGVMAGLLVGLGSLYIKAMFNYLAEAETTGMAIYRTAGLAVCIPLIVGGNIGGIAIMQLGFKHGKALVVVPVQQVTNKVVAIVGGMLALHEGLPDDSGCAFMRVSAFILIIASTIVLARFGGETVAEKMGETKE